MYALEKNFLFLPKPTLLIPHSDLAQCVFSRVGGPTSSFGGNPRSFDFKITVRGTGVEHLFSNIAKEELDSFVEYLRAKQISFVTEEEGRVRSKKEKEILQSDSENENGNNKKRRLDDLDLEDDEDESTDEDYNIDESSSDEESESDSEFESDDDDEDDEGSEMSE